jgi:hypothetical protein
MNKMVLQTKKELRFLKIIIIGMPVMLLVVIGVFGLNIWYANHLAMPVVRLLEIEGASAKFCNNHLSNFDSLKKSFNEISINKRAGSHPIRLETFLVEAGVESHILELGMDSSDNNIFWVYSEGGKLNKVVSGFIKSPYLADKFLECG